MSFVCRNDLRIHRCEALWKLQVSYSWELQVVASFKTHQPSPQHVFCREIVPLSPVCVKRLWIVAHSSWVLYQFASFPTLASYQDPLLQTWWLINSARSHGNAGLQNRGRFSLNTRTVFGVLWERPTCYGVGVPMTNARLVLYDGLILLEPLNSPYHLTFGTFESQSLN